MSLRDRRFLLLLAAAVLLAHGAVFWAESPDFRLIYENPNVKDPARLALAFLEPNPRELPGTAMPTYSYRPLAEATFAANLLLTGPSAAGIRAGSLLLHIATCVLVFLLARALAGEGIPAKGASLWVAVHPFVAQTFDYAYQRYVLLEALLAAGTLLGYLAAMRDPGPRGSRGYRIALVCMFAALLCKETAVTLPLLLAALEWILPGPPGRWKRLLPFIALTALVPVQVLRSGTFRPGDAGYAPLDHLLVQLPIVVGYLLQAAWPFPLAFHYDRVQIEPLRAALCAGLLLALGGWALLGSARHRLPRLGIALFLAPLALESSVFPIKHLGWNHRAIPSLLGGGLLFAWASGRLGRRALPLAAATLCLLATLTAGEHRLWQSEWTAKRRELRQAPHVPYLWSNRARQRFASGAEGHGRALLRQGLRQPQGALGVPEAP